MKKLLIFLFFLATTWCAGAQTTIDTLPLPTLPVGSLLPAHANLIAMQYGTTERFIIYDGSTKIVFADDGTQTTTLADGTTTTVALSCEAYLAITSQFWRLCEQLSQANDKVGFYERYFGRVEGDLSGPCVTVLPPPDKPKKCD